MRNGGECGPRSSGGSGSRQSVWFVLLQSMTINDNDEHGGVAMGPTRDGNACTSMSC